MDLNARIVQLLADTKRQAEQLALAEQEVQRAIKEISRLLEITKDGGEDNG